MGWLDGWPFKSKEQTEKERQAFEQRVFPLGEGQRAAAQAVLDELLVAKKMKASDRMFAFIVAKDRYELDERSPEAVDAARAQLVKLRWLSAEQIDLVLTLVRLDALVENLDDYPAAGDVRRMAGVAQG